jgi:hypothetical protein
MNGWTDRWTDRSYRNFKSLKLNDRYLNCSHGQGNGVNWQWLCLSQFVSKTIANKTHDKSQEINEYIITKIDKYLELRMDRWMDRSYRTMNSLKKKIGTERIKRI